MKRLIALACLAVAACEPLPTELVTTRPAPASAPVPASQPEPVIERATPAAVPAPVSNGIPISASLDCSVSAIGLFGNCQQNAELLCANAALTLARLDKIDPENPQIAGIQTNNASIVESGSAPATHRVTCV